MLIDAAQGLFAVLLGALGAYISFGRRQVDLFTIGAASLVINRTLLVIRTAPSASST